MDKLTPQKLIDNLNKNYPNLMEHCIMGYKKFYDIEQEFISKIQNNIMIKDVPNEQLNYLIAFSNIIQYGKSYFISQTIYNLIQMDNLTDYINFIGPLIHKNIIESNVIIEELPEEGQIGGQSFAFFLKFMTLILITQLTNCTAIANSISPLGFVSVSVDIENGKIPKAFDFKGELNPENEEEMIKFTEQFKQGIRFPTDKVTSKDITTLSKENLIKIMKQNMGSFVSLFLTDSQIENKFNEAIIYQTKRINLIVDSTISSLEEVCKSFVRTTDPKLPIPLYELFNSKMVSKLEEILIKKKQIMEQKREQIKQGIIEKRQIKQQEPGLTDIIKEEVITTTTGVVESISNIFYYPFSKTDKLAAEIQQIESPTARQIQDSYYEIEKAVENEISSLDKEIEISAFKELAENVMGEFEQETLEAQSSINLRIYLSSICQIKRPTYVYNQSEGLLYIKDPARSRTHLKVLANNVESYYNTVLKGIQSIKNGEVITDIPSEERKLNMKSLLEKSQVITEILSTYDIELMKTLLDNNQDVEFNTFFENIAQMWIKLKSKTIEALSQFPITERIEALKREREKESLALELLNEKFRHESEEQLRLQQIAQTKNQNKLSEEEWKVYNQWVGINTAGTLKIGTGLLNNGVDAIADLGNNAIDNVRMLADNGMASVISIAWGIALLGMILTLPAVMCISLKTGYINSLFISAKRRLENTPIPNNGPLQNTQLTSMPGIDALIKASQQIENEELRKQGGKLKKHKKTRKSNKRKTRKMKKNKNRQTKNRKKFPTKRH